MFLRSLLSFRIPRAIPFLLLISLMGISGVATASEPCDMQDSTHILIIHSYGPDMDWVGAVTVGLVRVFPSDDPEMAFYTEYMDGKIISDSGHYENLAGVYHHKYASIPLDLIFVSDDDAYSFVREYGDELFPGVPVVFFGVSGYTPAHREEMQRLTGMIEETRVAPTIDLITTLQPDVRDVYVVNDPTTTTGRIFAEELAEKTAAYNGTIAFHAPGEINMTTLCHDLQNLPPTTAVLLMDLNRDSEGRIYGDSEIAGIISASSPVPVYGISDTFIGHGVVGGVVTGTADQAEYAARMGAEILNGTPVTDIPVSGPPEAQVVVDYGEMQRYALPFSLLPEGSQIVNQPDERVSLPGWVLIVILAVAGSLIAVVLVLVRSNRRIRKTQEELNVSNHKLKTLFSITRHDINNQVMAAMGYLELLSDDVKEPPEAQDYIKIIRKSLVNIEEQVAFARDYEKSGTSAPVWQNPGAVAGRVSAISHEISVDVALPETEIYADPMLEKVFANLFGNAASHGEHATEVKITSSVHGDELKIIVEDNGRGIPAEKKGHIFKKGYGDNTGLGLFLVKDILAVTGLTITETGTYGKGARFEITVPKGRWRTVR